MVDPLSASMKVELNQDLKRLMVAIQGANNPSDILSTLVPSLTTLSPTSIGAVESWVRSYAGESPNKLTHSAYVLLFPELSWIWLFHGDGFCREAALKKLPFAALTTFYLTALFWRTNDWVAQVRNAAEFRLEAELASVSPTVASETVVFVLGRLANWKRLSPRSFGFVEALLRRSDVQDVLVSRLMAGGEKSRTADMKACLRFDILDAHLSELAEHSSSSAIRRLALRVLVYGYAEIPYYSHRVVTDSVYGTYKLVRNAEHRSVTTYRKLPSLIRVCLSDKSTMVRRMAADALILKRASFRDVDVLANALMNDRNASIRERGAFLLRTDSKNKPRRS